MRKMRGRRITLMTLGLLVGVLAIATPAIWRAAREWWEVRKLGQAMRSGDDAARQRAAKTLAGMGSNVAVRELLRFVGEATLGEVPPARFEVDSDRDGQTMPFGWLYKVNQKGGFELHEVLGLDLDASWFVSRLEGTDPAERIGALLCIGHMAWPPPALWGDGAVSRLRRASREVSTAGVAATMALAHVLPAVQFESWKAGSSPPVARFRIQNDGGHPLRVLATLQGSPSRTLLQRSCTVLEEDVSTFLDVPPGGSVPVEVAIEEPEPSAQLAIWITGPGLINRLVVSREVFPPKRRAPPTSEARAPSGSPPR